MRTHREGLTLIELLIVMVLGTFVAGAVYQTLAIQEQSYRATSAMLHDQDALRIGLGVLEAELRETASEGAAIGGTDLLTITADSVRFRAPRKLGFVCAAQANDKWVRVWNEGEEFAAGDGVLVFIEGEVTRASDDGWVANTVTSAPSDNTGCDTSPTGATDQKVNLDLDNLTGVGVGAPVRGYTETTYGLFQFGTEWGLGRLESDGTLRLVVGGLAGPGSGLVFEYFDDSGATTTNPANVHSIRITMETAPAPRAEISPSELSSTIYLRNN